MESSGSSPNERYAAWLTLFTIVGLVLMLGAWLWIKAVPIAAAPPQQFKVLFHYVNGLNKNASVFLDGVLVGAVENIELRAPKQVLVDVRINDKNAVVPEGTRFSIRTRGLVGAQYLDIELPAQMHGRKLLQTDSIAIGTDPLRTELIAEDLARKLEDVDFRKVNDSLSRLALAADHLSVLSYKLEPVATRATILEDRLGLLTDDLRGTTHRVDHLLHDHKIRGELKEVTRQACEASEHFDTGMARLQTVVGDKEARADLLQLASQVHGSTENIDSAVARVQSITGDGQLRCDAKQIVADTRDTVEKVDKLVSKPGLGAEVKATIREVHMTMEQMYFVGARLNRILDRRAPLLQLLFARPGHLQPECVAGQKRQIE